MYHRFLGGCHGFYHDCAYQRVLYSSNFVLKNMNLSLFLFRFLKVPENSYLGFLYAPVPMILSIASVSWLYFQYSGAEEGGYKIHIEDIFAQQKQLK